MRSRMKFGNEALSNVLPLTSYLSNEDHRRPHRPADRSADQRHIADDGSLVLGGRYLLVEAATTMINDRAMVRDLGPKAIVGPSDAMSPADLVRDLTSFDEIAPAPFAPFVSANIDETVAAPDMIPAPPPVLPRSELNTGKVSGERTEVQPAVPPRRK